MRHQSLLIFSLLNFFGLLIIWYLENFIGEHTGPTALLTYIPQHGFGVLSVVLIGCALYGRRRQLVALNCVSFLLFAFFLLGFQLPSPRFKNAKSVRVMTYNVRGAQADADEIAAEIREVKADIVCLQESAHTFGDVVSQRFPTWYTKSAGDVTTLSRYPLLSSEIWPFRGTRRILETRWQTPQGPLRVLNIHVSTSFRGSAEGDDNSRVRQVIAKAQPAAQARLEQIPFIEAASNKADTRSEATVLCGDFNTPPRGLFYRILGRDWHEAFAQSGFGIGATFPRNRPVLRIDYIWMKNGVQSKRTFVPDVDGSDHLPVVSDLVLPQ